MAATTIDRLGVADGPSALLAMREAWHDAAGHDPATHVEMDFPMLFALARHREQPGPWHWYTARQDSRLVNGLFGVRQRLARRALPLPVFVVGTEHTSDPLDATEAARPALRSLLARLLQDHASCPIIEFTRIRQDAAQAIAAIAADMGLGTTSNFNYNAYLFDTTQPLDVFRARLGPRLARNLRRERKRMAQRWTVELEVQHSRDPRANADCLERFIALEGAGWKGAGGSAIGSSDWHGNFYRCLLEHLGPGQEMRWYTLRADGRAISMYLCIRSGPTVWALKTAYDEDYAVHSPGNELLFRVVETLIDDGDIHRLHMVSGADWLAAWKPLAEPRLRLRLFNDTLAGRLAWHAALLRGGNARGFAPSSGSPTAG